MSLDPRLVARFAPFEVLAGALLPHAVPEGDGAHDAGHLLRVWRNAQRIQAGEGGDLRLLAAAVLLHDCVSVEKNAPDRAQASRRAADRADALLAVQGWDAPDRAAVAHAIHAHSFSAGITPETREARILQDADRLDALGMMGAARCFYIAGRLETALYDPLDPLAADRPLDDGRYALDHFERKLFTLAATFTTETGRALAAARHERLRHILAMMVEEA